MPVFHVIAGPPGIGKSTEGRYFIDSDIEILNHDILLLNYKSKNEVDYENLSNLRANQFINEQLNQNKSFGIELNLGYDNHYEILKFIKQSFPNYQTYITLFFTDIIDICLARAVLRYESGGHFVEKRIIQEMYKNTIPLLQKYSNLIDNIKLIDVGNEGGQLCFDLNKIDNKLFVATSLPNWITSNFPNILSYQ